MRAFLFAETRGSRMGEITENVPKPMLLVSGKPILQHSVEAIRDGGIHEIVISVAFRKEIIQDFFDDGRKFGVAISYLEPKKVNGMAFSLYHSRDSIQDDNFIVVQGDIIFESRLIQAMVEFQARCKHVVSMPVSKNLKAAEAHRLIKLGWRKRVKRIRRGLQGKIGEYRCIGAWGFSSKILEYLATVDMSAERELTVMTALEELFGQVPYFCLVYKGSWHSFHYPKDLF